MRDLKKAEKAIADFLEAMGLQLDDEHLVETPKRFVKAWDEHLIVGYTQDLESILLPKFNAEKYDEMIVLSDIPVYSLCSHHLVPFIGKAKVGYIPKNGKITGLSKLARVVDMYARRLQVQERLTEQIAQAVQKQLDPQGVGVVIEAEHYCMSLRGVKTPGVKTKTSCLLGKIRDEPETREEFLRL